MLASSARSLCEVERGGLLKGGKVPLQKTRVDVVSSLRGVNW
jgi:hypothetical protein